MALEDLQKLKKVVVSPSEKRFYRHLVVGHDLFSLATYKLLVEKYGQAEVGLLAKRAITREDLELKGPSNLRGQANIEHFKRLYPEVELNLNDQTSTFYKEQKFREFGGRSKSEALLWGEEFYVDQAARFNLKQVFTFIEDEEFFKQLSDKLEVRTPLAVELTTPEDLIDPTHWLIDCSSGLQLSCEKLYWGDGPAEFLELTRNKAQLKDEFIQYCDETRTPSSLFVKLHFEKPLTEMQETVFLPLSYTHEWGHFIGEFHEGENSEIAQEVEFVSFLVPEQTNEEEISKKIRILKRNLEKIFSDYSRNSHREHITLQEYSPCLKIDDSLYDGVRESIKNLSFISVNGPLEDFSVKESNFEYSRSNLSHMVRGLENLEQIKTNLV